MGDLPRDVIARNTDDTELRCPGFPDRERYDWPNPAAQKAVNRCTASFDELRDPDSVIADVLTLDALRQAEGGSGSQTKSILRGEVQTALAPLFFGDVRE